MIHFVLHDPEDTVAVVVVEGVKAGTPLTGWIIDEDKTMSSTARQDIPIGHKVALKDMAMGDTVIKYGIDMGKVVQPIKGRARPRAQHQDQALVASGAHARHALSLAAPTQKARPARSAARELRAAPDGRLPDCAERSHERRSGSRTSLAGRFMKNTFLGYRRENGRVGVRNHVIILPLDDLSNAAAEAVANNIKGTMAIPHPYGRLQFGADLDLHFRTLIGAGCNPNVAAVVVIGIEEQLDEEGRRRHRRDRQAGGRASASSCHGDHDTIMRASKAAREFVQWASETAAHRMSARPSCGSRPSAASPTRRQRLRRQPDGRRRIRQAARGSAARCASARRPN